MEKDFIYLDPQNNYEYRALLTIIFWNAYHNISTGTSILY